jgi:hypothetical protein
VRSFGECHAQDRALHLHGLCCCLQPQTSIFGDRDGQIMNEKENRHIRGFRQSKLRPGERIGGHLAGWIGKMMGKGDDKQRNGQFILTNQRACFYRKGFFGEVFETIPIAKLTSVETLSMMGYRVLRLHTSHDELAFKTFESKELFDRIYQRLENLRQRDGQETSVPRRSESIPDQIRKLGELRDAGVLSEDEFTAKKRELLARL